MSRLELIPNVFGGERCGSRGGIGLVPSCRKPSPIQAGAEHVRNRPLLCLPLLISLGKSGQGGPPANHPTRRGHHRLRGAVICTACIVHRSVVRQHVLAEPESEETGVTGKFRRHRLQCSCVRRFAVNRDRERAVSLLQRLTQSPRRRARVDASIRIARGQPPKLTA